MVSFKLISLNAQKKFFWRSKLTSKVQFWHFLLSRHHINSQNTIYSILIFGTKCFILYPLFGNSTTHITICQEMERKLSWARNGPFFYYCYMLSMIDGLLNITCSTQADTVLYNTKDMLNKVPYARHYNPLLIWNCSQL